MCKIKKEYEDKIVTTPLKIGQKIIVVYAKNSGTMCNKILTIQTINPQSYYTVEEGSSRTWSVYRNDSANTGATKDLYILATREVRADFIAKEVKALEEKIKELNKELVNLTKYKDDEEEVADKLFAIMQAKDKDSIAKVLRELKKTDYI